MEHVALAVEGVHALDAQERLTPGGRAGGACRGGELQVPEVRRLHVGVLLDLGRPALGDHAALVEHGDPVGERQHLIDVVIDQDDREGPVEGADQVGDADALVRREAGQRLVEQQELGARRERQGDLEQALVAVGQVRRDGPGLVGEADGGEEPQRLVVQVGEAPAVGEHREAAAMLRLRRDPHVLEHRERVEDADDLERARDAQRDDPVGEERGDGRAADPCLATVGGQEPRQEVEEGRLAGAVRADDRAQLAAAHLEGRAVHRGEGAEAPGEAADLEQGLHGRRRAGRRRGRRDRRDRRGRGRVAGDLGAPAEAAQTLGDADDAVRREHDEGDEDHAEVDEPVLGPRRERVAHEDEDGRAHGRADEAPHAADEGHGGDLARHRDVERLRIGEVQEEGVERAGEAAERARDDERGELVALDVVPDEAGALLVLADRLEHATEGRVDDAPEEPDRRGGERGGRVVVDALVGEVEAERAEAQGEALDAAEAVLAARHGRRAIDDVEEHLGEGEGEEREVDAALAHEEEADRRAREPGRRDTGQERDDHAPRDVDLREAGRVTAEAEEGAVAERDQARVAHEEVVRDREQREDHDLGAERDGGIRRGHQEREREEPGEEPGEGVPDEPGDQSNFSQRSPMSPRGRSRRITAISTYIEASATRGWK